MPNAIHVEIKVRNIKNPKDELSIALSKFKRKVKETGILTEYLAKQYFIRPAEKRRQKSKKARSRKKF